MLNKAWEAASQEIYAAQQSADAAGGSNASGADAESDQKDTDVSDVEYEEVDDKK